MSYTFHEEEYRGFKIRIESDDDPINPRKDYDNVGTMVCWHRRYELGDERPKEEAGDYLAGLARGDPAFDKVDVLFDKVIAGGSEAACDRVRSRWLKAREAALGKGYVILPLYLYDHSGITMSTGAFSCPWDSGQVGFIYCTMKKALHEWGTKGQEHLGWDGEASYTPKPDGSKRTLREAATSYLEGEVKDYDNYLTGQCAGWIAKDPDGETINSVWGYYPDDTNGYAKQWDDPIAEAKHSIDCWHDRQDKEATEAAHWAARDVQTISQPT